MDYFYKQVKYLTEKWTTFYNQLDYLLRVSGLPFTGK